MFTFKKRSKYRNIPTIIDGIRFDSKHEARVYGELCILKKAGFVASFKDHVTYPLHVNGVHVCDYESDFDVLMPDGKFEIWDAKGMRTREYRLKKKLMLAVYGIEIVEK